MESSNYNTAILNTEGKIVRKLLLLVMFNTKNLFLFRELRKYSVSLLNTVFSNISFLLFLQKLKNHSGYQFYGKTLY